MAFKAVLVGLLASNGETWYKCVSSPVWCLDWFCEMQLYIWYVYHDSIIGKSIYQQNLATLKNPAGTCLDTEGRGITQSCCLITDHTSMSCFLKFINFLQCHVPHRHTDLRDWVLHTTWNRLEWLIMPLIDPKLVGLSTMSVWKTMWSHYATRQYKTDRNSGCIWSHMYSLALGPGQDTGVMINYVSYLV